MCKICVSGTEFTTFKTTILKSSVLTSLAEKNQTIYFDMDPSIFSILLNFMREGVLDTKGVSLNSITNAADRIGLQLPLMDGIFNIIKKLHKRFVNIVNRFVKIN